MPWVKIGKKESKYFCFFFYSNLIKLDIRIEALLFAFISHKDRNNIKKPFLSFLASSETCISIYSRPFVFTLRCYQYFILFIFSESRAPKKKEKNSSENNREKMSILCFSLQILFSFFFYLFYGAQFHNARNNMCNARCKAFRLFIWMDKLKLTCKTVCKTSNSNDSVLACSVKRWSI